MNAQMEKLIEDGKITSVAYSVYGDMEGKKVIVFRGYQSDEEDIKTLEEFCDKNNLIWAFDDEIIIDYDMDIAYKDESDVIIIDGDVAGRYGFETDEYNFEWLKDEFVSSKNNIKERVLPSWLDDKILKEFGFEKLEDEYDNGMYEYNKNLSIDEIFEQQKNNDKIEMVFKVSSSSQFEVLFNGYVKNIG